MMKKAGWLRCSGLGLVVLFACKSNASPEAPAAEPSAHTETKASDSPHAAAQPKAAEAKLEAHKAEPEKSQPAKPERTADGYDVIRAKIGSGETEVAVKAPEGWKVTRAPSKPDPRGGKFALKDALVKDLLGKQPLVATIRTNLGTLYCDLFDDKAPVTVANFIGLARGTRETWSAKDDAWLSKPYYDGTTFHRVIPEFMIQGGDYAGDGSGNMFYQIPDEVNPTLKHDRAGQLCMANSGPNTNEAQFFITEAAAPHLDGSYTIFGQCTPTEIVGRIARVPQSGPPNNRPLTPVVIEKVKIERRAGGANAAAAAAGVSAATPLGGPRVTAPATSGAEPVTAPKSK